MSLSPCSSSPFSSPFSSPDALVPGTPLIGVLDDLAIGLGAMKAYAAAALRRAVPGGLVLDLGCGTGPDLALLAAAGMRPIGLDRSAALLAEAAARLPSTPLVRSDAAALPFAAAAFDGCRIERVLQHVESPAAVLGEVARVVRPGGALAVFEPDWTTITIASELSEASEVDALFARARHPRIGGDLPDLVSAAGFAIDDVVTEASRTERPEGVPWDIDAVVGRANSEDRVDAATARRWLAEQRQRAADGRFEARWSKVLVVATRR